MQTTRDAVILKSGWWNDDCLASEAQKASRRNLHAEIAAIFEINDGILHRAECFPLGIHHGFANDVIPLTRGGLRIEEWSGGESKKSNGEECFFHGFRLKRDWRFVGRFVLRSFRLSGRSLCGFETESSSDLLQSFLATGAAGSNPFPAFERH